MLNLDNAVFYGTPAALPACGTAGIPRAACNFRAGLTPTSFLLLLLMQLTP
jgi:hypothetical protein